MSNSHRLGFPTHDCLQVVRSWDGLGVALHLVDIGGSAVDTSSAMGRFFLTVMGGAAELERNVVGQRTSLAMRHMASRNMCTGGHARYGFRVVEDGKLEPIDDEQHVSSPWPVGFDQVGCPAVPWPTSLRSWDTPGPGSRSWRARSGP